MSKDKKAPRLVTRQFATPLTREEVDQVSGGCSDNGPTTGTCTRGPDSD
jgi:hypothetical protein